MSDDELAQKVDGFLHSMDIACVHIPEMRKQTAWFIVRAMSPSIRADAMEEAAQICEEQGASDYYGECAAAIRRAKGEG